MVFLYLECIVLYIARRTERIISIDVDICIAIFEIEVLCSIPFIVGFVEGVLYIIARSAGKYYGSNVSCRLTGQPKPIVDNLGITLLPQAGVALGMAMTAASLPDGAMVRNVVLFAVLVYELVGPALTKRSLLAVGEIRPEGRTSARRSNAKA